MKSLQLYNSLSNSLETFVPISSGNIGLYVCGPTVYSSPHIGNARPMVIFDVLFRLLKKLYGGRVTYVRNITDVDDKINARAKTLGVSIRELTDEVIDAFHKNMASLNVLSPTHEPRATDHISNILEIIQRLINNEFAYESRGHVLFRVKKMADYGLLSKRNVDDMIAGSRVEIAPYKEDPMDFVLWKPSDSETPGWDSQFGYGRPGWHVECSAMSLRFLGEKFDIHAGGHDLMFPHHENEIAQNYGAFGCIMANYWIHNGMLLVNGEKMSKSLGNIIPLDEALKKFDGEIIRYVLLGAHYQKTLNWTDQLVFQAKQSLNRLFGALQLENGDEDNSDCLRFEEESTIMDALCSNLNTPLALSYLHEIADRIYKSKNQKEINALCRLLKQESDMLGLLKRNPKSWFQQKNESLSEDEILSMIAQRREAKNQKNFKLADEIRSKLLGLGVQIEDGPGGTTWKTL